MKSKIFKPVIALVFISVIFITGFYGCKSAPDNSAAIADLITDVDKIRQLDIDEGFDTAFQEKWTAAESSYEAAKSLSESGSEEAMAALQDSYNLYKEIYDLGMAARSENLVDSESLETRLAQARTKALEAGAGEMFKEQFDSLDSKTLPSLEGGDKAAVEAYENQIAAYEALEYLAYAKDKAKVIEERGLASYDEASYGAGNTAFGEALNLIASDSRASRDKARFALESYQKVIDTAYKLLGEEAEKSLLKEKELCDSIKAGVSMKEAYSACEASYSQGLELKKSGKYEESYFIFEGLISGYADVYKQAYSKREAALAAMEAAADKQAGVKALALEADKIAPLEGADEPEYELPEENLSVEEIESAGFTTGSTAGNAEQESLSDSLLENVSEVEETEPDVNVLPEETTVTDNIQSGAKSVQMEDSKVGDSENPGFITADSDSGSEEEAAGLKEAE